MKSSLTVLMTSPVRNASWPYRIMPSKNRTLPKGMENRQFGSWIRGNCRKIIAPIQTKKIRQSAISSRLTLSGYIKCIILTLSIFCGSAQANCHGKFVNPLTDVCWKCVFPLTIMGIDIVKGNPSPKGPKGPVCFCKKPPLNLPMPGVPIGFWEPVRLIDIT